MSEPLSDGGNRLPSNPKELQDAIEPYRLMVSPVLHAVSKMAEVAGTSPLDKTEHQSGEIAFGALIYQYGGKLDARVLGLLWFLAVSVPRVIEYLEKKDKEKKLAATQVIGSAQ